MKIGRLVFHIGVPKTGTSLLQRSLRHLQAALLDTGVAYVDRTRWLELDTYRGWAAYGRDHIAPSEFQTELRSVFDATQGVDGGTVITSNEAASGWDSDLGVPFWKDAHEAVSQVVEALEPTSTEIVVYLRRQDRFLESLYMELIHIGRAMEWETFRDLTCRDDRVRYSDLISAVESVDGVDRVHVRAFETIAAGARAFVAGFLDLVDAGMLAAHLDDAALSVARPSFTRPAWEAALGLNHLIDSPDQFRRLRRFLTDLFPADRYPPAELLTDEERAHVLEAHRSDNESVFERHMPGFPLTTYSTADGIKMLAEGTAATPHTS